MNIPYYYTLNLILLTRLFFHYRDHSIGKKAAAGKCAIELAGLLLLSFNIWVLLLAGIIVLINGLQYFLERSPERMNLKRLFTLLLYFVVLNTLFAPYFEIDFNSTILGIFRKCSDLNLGISFLLGINWHYSLITFTGLLLSLNESNIFIRYLFEVLKLVPVKNPENRSSVVDEQEYNRGRVIGFLERILIYFFVLNNHFSAIGFILAAKGITRFKKLEERTFAEYFLIGTLLSAILAGAIAIFIAKRLS